VLLVVAILFKNEISLDMNVTESWLILLSGCTVLTSPLLIVFAIVVRSVESSNRRFSKAARWTILVTPILATIVVALIIIDARSSRANIGNGIVIEGFAVIVSLDWVFVGVYQCMKGLKT
jgi:hypothetical protein